MYIGYGSHFSRLKKFTDFSSIFFNVLFLTEKFIHFSKYHYKHQIIFISNSLSFPVFCVISPDFSLTGKFLPIFPGFLVWEGTLQEPPRISSQYQWDNDTDNLLFFLHVITCFSSFMWINTPFQFRPKSATTFVIIVRLFTFPIRYVQTLNL